MFGKLMKYELRYLIRIFAPMWVIVFVLCVLSRLTVRPDLNGMMYVEGAEAILPVLAVMLAVIGIITMMIVATVVLLQRFYKGMFGDEGYLMFTLPVTTGSLIHSKAMSAFIMMVVTEIITMAGVLIMVSYKEIWVEMVKTDWTDVLEMILEMNGLTGIQAGLLVFWVLVAGLLSIVEGIYSIYLAIAIGQLWKKHPVAGAIGAYYLMSLVLNFLIGGLGATRQGYLLEQFTANMEYGAAMAAVLIVSILACVVLSVVCFLLTRLILDKKLNIT